MLVDTKQAIVHPRIASSYWVTNSCLILYTDKIYIKSKVDQQKYYIGKFQIQLNKSPYYSRTCTTNITNLDNKKVRRGRFWAHPHVVQGGAPCWKEQQYWLGQYMEQRDYESVVELLLVYLESYNDLDPYAPYKLWLPNG